MPQSLSSVYLHLVFSTKERRPFLRDPALREATHAWLGAADRTPGEDFMKIGGEYLLHKIGARQWQKATDEWSLNQDLVRKHLFKMTSMIPSAATELAEAMTLGEKSEQSTLPLLAQKIIERAEICLSEFKASK